MCAGVTVYDPMRRYGATRGSRVGVVGLGGLGQMAVKIAGALGCEVTVISRSRTKEGVTRRASAASTFVCSEERESVDAHRRSLDLIPEHGARASRLYKVSKVVIARAERARRDDRNKSFSVYTRRARRRFV